MFCTKCGHELQESDLFCAKCGKATRPGYGPAGPILSRPMDQKRLGGVCAGFARYFDMDVTLMRILWIAGFILSGGLVFVVYICAWILMPRDWPAPPAATQRVVEC
jgi:phage shock protein C